MPTIAQGMKKHGVPKKKMINIGEYELITTLGTANAESG